LSIIQARRTPAASVLLACADGGGYRAMATPMYQIPQEAMLAE
jgi:hypothetical protein